MKTSVAIVLAALICGFTAKLDAETILLDNFDSWNSANWRIPTWKPGGDTYLGRTQLRVSQQSWRPQCDGALTLRLDTYNPTALTPGDSFFGSEIISQQSFLPQPGESYVFSARFRGAQETPGGIVASMFLYQAGGIYGVRDEVDCYEVLTKDQPQGPGLSTNVFKQEPFSATGDWNFEPLAGFDPQQWHTMSLTWTTDSLTWVLDGVQIRQVTGPEVPSANPMNLRFNIWAPDSTWPAAYDGSLVPVASASTNQVYGYELDWALVTRTVPEPCTAVFLAAGAGVLALRRRQRGSRTSTGSCTRPPYSK